MYRQNKRSPTDAFKLAASSVRPCTFNARSQRYGLGESRVRGSGILFVRSSFGEFPQIRAYLILGSLQYGSYYLGYYIRVPLSSETPISTHGRYRFKQADSRKQVHAAEPPMPSGS